MAWVDGAENLSRNPNFLFAETRKIGTKGEVWSIKSLLSSSFDDLK